MQIRGIQRQDYPQVKKLLQEAFSESHFGYQGEAELVEKIRQDPSYRAEFELVAVEHQQIVGQVLLSQVTISQSPMFFIGQALAPLAVLPEQQQRGIGGKLITAIEAAATEKEIPFIIVLGEAEYYSKFGYQKASDYQISAPFSVPDEAFLVKFLSKKAQKQINGVVNYLSAFD